MGFLVTNSVNISIGEAKTNVWGKATFHTQELLITGKVQCDLSFYKSEADDAAGKDKIYPLDANGNKVTNCVVDCAINDVIKASGQSTMQDVVDYFYKKVEAKLEADYGWTITLD